MVKEVGAGREACLGRVTTGTRRRMPLRGHCVAVRASGLTTGPDLPEPCAPDGHSAVCAQTAVASVLLGRVRPLGRRTGRFLRALAYPLRVGVIDRAAWNPCGYEGGRHGWGNPGRAFALRYRSLYPPLTLLQPTRLGEAVQGWVSAYKEGGWLPAWSAPGCCHSYPARRRIPPPATAAPRSRST